MDEKVMSIIGWCGVGAVALGTSAVILTGGSESYVTSIVAAVVIVIGAIFAKKN